jgi:hypothetical protein
MQIRDPSGKFIYILIGGLLLFGIVKVLFDALLDKISRSNENKKNRNS